MCQLSCRPWGEEEEEEEGWALPPPLAAQPLAAAAACLKWQLPCRRRSQPVTGCSTLEATPCCGTGALLLPLLLQAQALQQLPVAVQP